jgi:hypothetical protein
VLTCKRAGGRACTTFTCQRGYGSSRSLHLLTALAAPIEGGIAPSGYQALESTDRGIPPKSLHAPPPTAWWPAQWPGLPTIFHWAQPTAAWNARMRDWATLGRKHASRCVQLSAYLRYRVGVRSTWLGVRPLSLRLSPASEERGFNARATVNTCTAARSWPRPRSLCLFLMAAKA